MLIVAGLLLVISVAFYMQDHAEISMQTNRFTDFIEKYKEILGIIPLLFGAILLLKVITLLLTEIKGLFHFISAIILIIFGTIYTRVWIENVIFPKLSPSIQHKLTLILNKIKENQNTIAIAGFITSIVITIIYVIW